MTQRSTAAIVTIGSELIEGLRVDTNTAEIARDLQRFGFSVSEATSVGDDPLLLQAQLSRLITSHDLVVTTGGLGPTHDDITREAVANALGLAMHPDPHLTLFLQPFISRHSEPHAAEQMLSQALLIEGAEVLIPTNGTAPGQVLETPAGLIVLLPGPPAEMRPMLAEALGRFEAVRANPVDLGVCGLAESDVQLAAQRALSAFTGIQLTVLAKPGDVRVLLLDEGAGEQGLLRAAKSVAQELGRACYASDGSTLAQTVIRLAESSGTTIATAESCTGGLVSAALTDVAGSSAAFLGGVTAYANSAKRELLDVPDGLLAQYGAVSEETARAMAEGVRERFGADIAVATTGIAGPGGGTPGKPVGLVWFGVATGQRSFAVERRMTGSGRAAIRARSTSLALDLIRREILGP